jgi:hypothetical protein
VPVYGSASQGRLGHTPAPPGGATKPLTRHGKHLLLGGTGFLTDTSAALYWQQESILMNQRALTVTHVSLDREDQRIRDFVRSFPVDPEGTLVELDGQAIYRVLQAVTAEFDPVKLKAAILNRRDASQESNKEWNSADRETWDPPAGAHE